LNDIQNRIGVAILVVGVTAYVVALGLGFSQAYAATAGILSTGATAAVTIAYSQFGPDHRFRSRNHPTDRYIALESRPSLDTFITAETSATL
ncbi:hypothetical protein HDU84_001604, partial [Entophlyctis sp. JEL0112]